MNNKELLKEKRAQVKKQSKDIKVLSKDLLKQVKESLSINDQATLEQIFLKIKKLKKDKRLAVAVAASNEYIYLLLEEIGDVLGTIIVDKNRAKGITLHDLVKELEDCVKLRSTFTRVIADKVAINSTRNSFLEKLKRIEIDLPKLEEKFDEKYSEYKEKGTASAKAELDIVENEIKVLENRKLKIEKILNDRILKVFVDQIENEGIGKYDTEDTSLLQAQKQVAESEIEMDKTIAGTRNSGLSDSIEERAKKRNLVKQEKDSEVKQEIAEETKKVIDEIEQIKQKVNL